MMIPRLSRNLVIGITSRKIAVVFLVAFSLFGQIFAIASDWISVGGNVHFGTTPVCALVLINGQAQFSCDGTGRYDMQIPVDDNGMITVMAFADGFAPFNQIVTPEQAADYAIDILLDQQSPTLEVSTMYEPSTTEGRFVISGTVNSGPTPVCALVLANGQNKFSCNENVGQYSLDVPIDQDGNITLMVFADGFKPFKVITQVVQDSDGDGIKNYLDYDDDNDGIFDVDDACPLNPSLNCVTTIFADGKEWLQVSLFTNLSWNDINAVCPVGNGGVCSGALNGHDISGWTWASAPELGALFDYYGFEPPPPELVGKLGFGPGTLALGEKAFQAWITAGWFPTSIGCPWDYCIYALGGYTRDSFDVGVTSEPRGHMAVVIWGADYSPWSVYGQANSYDESRSSPDLRDISMGGWFYRSP
jgi:hypothetical protein